MNSLEIHKVTRIAISKSTEYSTFVALNIRIQSENGDIDVVCYADDFENLVLTHLDEEEI